MSDPLDTAIATLLSIVDDAATETTKEEVMRRITQALYGDPTINAVTSSMHAEATNGVRAMMSTLATTAARQHGPQRAHASCGSFLASSLQSLSLPTASFASLDQVENVMGEEGSTEAAQEVTLEDLNVLADQDQTKEGQEPPSYEQVPTNPSVTSSVQSSHLPPQVSILKHAMIAMRGHSGNEETKSRSIQNHVEQAVLLSSSSTSRVAYVHNKNHTLEPLRRVLERLSSHMSIRDYNDSLRPDRGELAQSFGLQRHETEHFFRLWKNKKEQQKNDAPIIQDARSTSKASGGASVLEQGLVVECQDKHYVIHNCSVESFKIDEMTNRVEWIEVVPLHPVAKDSFSPSTQEGLVYQGDGTAIIRFERHTEQNQFELPKHVCLPVMPAGTTGMGASVPLVLLLMFMYNMGLLQIINGIIHLCFVGDGTQTGRSVRQRWLSTCLIGIVPMGDGILIRSVLNSVVSMAWSASDNRGTWTAHGIAHAIELKESLEEVERRISIVEGSDVKIIVVGNCDGKFLTDVDTILKKTATMMNRRYAWTHRARYNLCRSVLGGEGDHLFYLPCQTGLENLEKHLRKIHADGVAGAVDLAEFHGLDLTTQCSFWARHLRFHELLHNTGRAAQVFLSIVVALLSLCGLMENFEDYCRNVLKIAIDDGYTIAAGAIENSMFKMRVGIMRALALHPKLMWMKVEAKYHPVMEVLAQLALAFRLSRGIFNFYLTSDVEWMGNLLDEIQESIFFYAVQYDRLLALVRGSIAWKPTSLHFTFRYPFWVWYANKHGLDLCCIDGSVIETFHNFTKRAFRKGGGGGGGAGRCKFEGEAVGMLEVVLECMRRIIASQPTQEKRCGASLKKKARERVLLVSRCVAVVVVVAAAVIVVVVVVFFFIK